MKQSKKDIEKAILTISYYIGQEDGEKAYKALIESGTCPLPELVKIMSYKLFTNKIEQYFVEDDKTFQAIQIIREYAIELEKIGFVTFDEKFDSDKYMQSLKK